MLWHSWAARVLWMFFYALYYACGLIGFLDLIAYLSLKITTRGCGPYQWKKKTNTEE